MKTMKTKIKSGNSSENGNRRVNHSLKRMMSGCCSTALIACFLLGGFIAFAQTSYRFTDLDFFLARKKVFPPRSMARGLSPGLQARKPRVRPRFVTTLTIRPRWKT